MSNTALIVTYNRIEKLKISLKATLALPFEYVVIINNNSSDGTTDWLKSVSDKRVIVINSSRNIGGAGGFKLGAEYITKNLKTDWIVFYDDDAYPGKDFLNKFNDLKKNINDIYCSKVIDANSEICQMNLPWRKLPETLMENFNYYKNKQDFCADIDTRCEVITFSFVGCILHSTVLRKTYELIVEDLFIYFDDVFYSFQLKLMGFNIIYEPSLIFQHDIDSNNNKPFPAWKVYYLTRNIIRSCHILKEEKLFSIGAIILRIVKYLTLIKGGYNKQLFLRYYFKGIWHGIRNVGGKNH
ncbi:glycosyltransferase [Pantoea dispersa]|uniref:glycosyltransferase n=1 Tax=Pantoea dispersa TaxID=59814 RepID=UPI0021C68E97|nr:glycosyltransferase [Pantoea dispersa]